MEADPGRNRGKTKLCLSFLRLRKIYVFGKVKAVDDLTSKISNAPSVESESVI